MTIKYSKRHEKKFTTTTHLKVAQVEHEPLFKKICKAKEKQRASGWSSSDTFVASFHHLTYEFFSFFWHSGIWLSDSDTMELRLINPFTWIDKWQKMWCVKNDRSHLEISRTGKAAILCKAVNKDWQTLRSF